MAGGRGVGMERGLQGRGRVLKAKQYARLSDEVKYKKSNYVHNVKHVVQSPFQNMLNF